MIRLLVLFLGLLALQVEGLETCVTKKECLADVDNFEEIATERFTQKGERAVDAEEELVKSFKANITAFNKNVENASSRCHNHMILDETAVITAEKLSFWKCRKEIRNYPPADRNVKIAINDIWMNETLARKNKKKYCEVYSQFVNYYCGYFDHQYEIYKNGCDVYKVFEAVYVDPWKECMAQVKG